MCRATQHLACAPGGSARAMSAARPRPAPRAAALRAARSSAACCSSRVGTAVTSQTTASLAEPAAPFYEPQLERGGGDSGGDDDLPPNGGDGTGWSGDGGSSSDGDDGAGVEWAHPLGVLLRGVRGRLAADPNFALKLGIECGLDACIIVGVNRAARGDRFLQEIDFTLCQLAISLLSDFALVYLLAPSTLRSTAAAGTLRARVARLPAHIFQRAPPGVAPFSPAKRLATFALKALQYGGVGFGMGCLGSSAVQGLTRLRELLDPGFVPPATVQSALGTGAAWAGFMATSSNARYNVVNGMEDALYRRGTGLGRAGSVALRLLNNWAGAAQWVVVTERLALDRAWVPAAERRRAGALPRAG